MEFDHIEAFVSVATLGGFTKASRELHRSQPAVSRRIKGLEAELGVRLFERHGREVHLTTEGRALLPHAQAAVAAMRDGARAVAESSSSTASGPPISIAIVGTLADAALAEALREFRQGVPETPVSLRTATSREVSLLVRSGEAEFGVRYFSDRHPDLTCTALGSERLSLVVDADHRLSGQSVVTGTDLAREHWLSFPVDAASPDSFGLLLQRELLGLGISEPNLTVVDSLTAQVRLVQAGYGIALMPLSSCHEGLAAGTLRAITVKSMNPRQPIVAIRRRSGFRRKSAKVLLKLISEHLTRKLAA